MRRRVLVVYVALLLSALAGALIGSQSPYAAARSITPTPPYPVAPVIPGAGTAVQIWMAGPFCVDTWWDGRQCSEHKGDEHKIGAGWKLDLPGPAWVAPQGKDAQGRWLLWLVAKDGEQSPGASFTAVIGPSLYAATDAGNGTPTPTAPLTSTSPPPMGATATPPPTVASGATATPSPQGEATPTRTATPSTTGTPRILYGNMCRPDPAPEYPHSITIYGQGGLTAPAMFWYCMANQTPDLIYIVSEKEYRDAYDNGPRKLLEDLGR